MRGSESAVDVNEIAFEAFGVRVLVSASGADELDRMRALLPPGWRSCPASSVEKRFAITPDETGAYQLVNDGESVTKRLEFDLALELLEAQVRAYVALEAPDRIFVHAGVVAHRGRTIVLPGMSFTGKTTLVAALVRAGAIYFSDEFAVLDEEGLVHPYAKPLSLRADGGSQTDHDVGSLGGIAGEDPLPIGAIVATGYRPGADWRPRRCSAGEGVLALLANTVPAQSRPTQTMRILTRAAKGPVVVQSERGEADELAPLLLAELDH